MRFIAFLSTISLALACPQHESQQEQYGLGKRSGGSTSWSYSIPNNWGSLSKDYTTCQTGTTQSPIGIHLYQSLASVHVASFKYSSAADGTLSNWGYGPTFTLNTTNGDLSANPSMTYDDETVFLKGFHTHSPSEHLVANKRSRAELHLVHATADGHERAVVSIRIDPGSAPSPFLAQLLSQTPAFDSSDKVPLTVDPSLALQEVDMVNEFWTYKGSLTTPPCTEGIRWFVAKKVLQVSVEQMQALLGVSKYSARMEQEVWQHDINA